jgi:hypothetical protein
MDRGRTGEAASGRGTTGATAPHAAGQSDAATPEELASEARDAAAGVAREVADEVQRRTTARLGEQVGRAAERLGGVSQAVHAVGRQLREQDDDAMAAWAERAAEQVDRFSGYLRGKDVDELLYEGERFARRQPALFLGGAFALGLLAARFLKSSGRYDARYGQRDWLAHYGPPPHAPHTAPPSYGVSAPMVPPPPPSGAHPGAATGPGRVPTDASRGTAGSGSDSAGTSPGTRHPGAPVGPA